MPVETWPAVALEISNGLFNVLQVVALTYIAARVGQPITVKDPREKPREGQHGP